VFVGIAIGLILFLAAALVGWYDKYAVQRDYADRFAKRYGRIPPLMEWFFSSDADADVESLRVQHRNMYILSSVLAVAAAVVVLLAVSTTKG
jgi:hypothetical protein